MSKEPGREQNWYPVSKLGWFTGHIREGVEATRRQLELLQPARARPYVLDAATVARIIRVHRDQAGDLTLFQNQADRRKTDPGLTAAQRAGIAADVDELARARRAQDLNTAAVLPDPRAERRRRQAEPDLEFCPVGPRDLDVIGGESVHLSPPPHSQPPGQGSGPAACIGHRRPQPAARQCARHEHGHG